MDATNVRCENKYWKKHILLWTELGKIVQILLSNVDKNVQRADHFLHDVKVWFWFSVGKIDKRFHAYRVLIESVNV